MRPCTWRASLLVAVCLALTVPCLRAQYFGQNKVRYRTYDFKILKTEHFDIYYYPKEKEAADEAARMAERWYYRHSLIFGAKLPGRQPIILYGSFPSFQETTITPEIIGVGTGGFTEPLRRRVVLYLGGSLGDTNHVVGHELVHAFQFSILPNESVGTVSNVNLPLWFIEGMAEYLSLGPVDPNTTMWMRDAVERNDIPSLGKLDNPKYFPYRWGQMFWAYVGGRYGDKAVGAMMKAAASGGIGAAIQDVLHISESQLSKDWAAALRNSANRILQVTTPVQDAGHVLVREQAPGFINVSPSLSPDGKYFMFFSEKGLFSIDLYLADAQTGRIIRRITNTAIDPHLNNLEFINSAGSWSPDSRQFAFGHVSGATPEISIYDVNKSKVVRTIPFKGLGEIFCPTWSPDGRQIAFSAISGGFTNLYVVDVDTGKMRQLTNDPYAELEPAWSPDGKTIAFVTDRFTTDMSDLNPGQLQLALYHLDSGTIQPVRTFNSGKSIDPHWSAGGSSLYFVSDHDGISNIYRITLAGHTIDQITDVQTGVSGITDTSPAISVSTRAERMLFSIFSDGGYEIMRLDGEKDLAGQPPTTQLAGLSAGILPPRTQPGGEIVSLFHSPQQGLASLAGAKVVPYSSRLSLDYIAPPEVGVGFGSFGTLVGGGTAFHFSDMLGYQNLTVAAQTEFAGSGGNLLRNIAAQAIYLNQRSRWNWGFMGGQVPYAAESFAESTGTVAGEPALIQQDIIFWQTDRQAGGILQYPINLAQRLEFDGGFDNISFAARATTQAYSLLTGNLIAVAGQILPTPPSLNFGVADAAFVDDTSLFGGVSPVAGRRYRLQWGIAGGSIRYYTGLADFRQYFHLARPLSLAFRGLSFGRYGPGSDDPRLQDFFLGYPNLVRGYGVNSFSISECGPQFQTTGACPVFDRLLGSRLLVGNAEMRLELLGPLGVIPHTLRVPPIEAAPFFDAGEAWTSSQSAGFLGGPRQAVSSEGIAFRFNFFGAFVGEISGAHPNNRPGEGWEWQFSFLPGF